MKALKKSEPRGKSAGIEAISTCSGLYYRHDGTQDKPSVVATHSEKTCTVGNQKLYMYWWGRNFAFGCTSFR
jgi:hypothetical protein